MQNAKRTKKEKAARRASEATRLVKQGGTVCRKAHANLKKEKCPQGHFVMGHVRPV